MISVIIPVYNGERYLTRCVEAVLASACPDLEVLLIDDGSADGSLALCRSFEERDRRVRVLSQENRGVSSARNRGIRESRGEWLMFVDADDEISPDLPSLADRAGEWDLLLFDFTEGPLPPSGGAPAETLYEGGALLGLLERTLVPRPLPEGGTVNFTSVCGRAYRRALLEQWSIAFDEALFYGEDRLFNLEYLSRAGSCAHISAAVYRYEYHGDSVSHRYHEGFLSNHARLAERMKTLLEERGLFPALEGAYASCVLSHMASLLTYLIFDPRRERPFAQRRALCEELRETAVFQEALEHNRPRESLRRWVYLFAFQRRWYHTAGLICRVMHLRLRHTTQREREAAP